MLLSKLWELIVIKMFGKPQWVNFHRLSQIPQSKRRWQVYLKVPFAHSSVSLAPVRLTNGACGSRGTSCGGASPGMGLILIRFLYFFMNMFNLLCWYVTQKWCIVDLRGDWRVTGQWVTWWWGSRRGRRTWSAATSSSALCSAWRRLPNWPILFIFQTITLVILGASSWQLA